MFHDGCLSNTWVIVNHAPWLFMSRWMIILIMKDGWFFEKLKKYRCESLFIFSSHWWFTVFLPNEQLSLQVSSISFVQEPRVSVQSDSWRFVVVVVQFDRVNIFSLWFWVKRNSVYQSLLSQTVSCGILGFPVSC